MVVILFLVPGELESARSALSLTVAPPRDFELSELGAKVRGTAVGEYFALVPRLTRLRRSTHTSIHMSLRAHV